MAGATNMPVKQPFNEIAKKYDLLNDFMSLGLHRAWKNSLFGALSDGLPQSARVLDLATGTGDVASLFLKRLPPERIFAADPCEPMMNEGKKKYPELKQWHCAMAESLPFEEQFFSVVTCTFGVRNFQHRTLAFQEIARVLKPNGKFGILEIHPIPQKLRYFPFRIFWRYGIPLWGRLFSRLRAYEYLRDTAAQFISPEVMVEELQRFFDIEERKPLLGGGLVTLIIAKKR
ncbi:ubiquinone/menaquinone biosynthesis methyltransferase [bacterium]|nr:ubiquinone/menaquinone biosynthesis methyltransferase [bacterium]